MDTDKVIKGWIAVLRKNILWLLGAIAALTALILIEGSMVVTTKLFGVMKATLLRVVITIPLSWLVIYLATRSKKSFRFTNWLAARQAKLSNKARVAIEGGKFVVVVNTAIFLGPIVASILMLMVGITPRRIYGYAVLCAFLSAWLWSAFYSGLLWQLTRMLT
jgi:hypothetical protein